MKKIITKALSKVNRFSNSLERELTFDKNDPKNVFEVRSAKWFEDDGDNTLRLFYDLNEDSLIFDLGGYKGNWASDIYSMYTCKVVIFEPYLPFAEKIEKRFLRNRNITVHRFGIGPRTEELGFSMRDEASSVFIPGPKNEKISIVSVVDFLRDNNIHSVDLIKINIEGGEYELLEVLIESGLVKIFKNIQVQFHDFVIPEASQRMKSIQKKLELTHNLTYYYEFIWENWELKNK